MTETPTNEDFMAAHINTLKEEISALRLALVLERERCAKVCCDIADNLCAPDSDEERAVNNCVASIRALPDLCDLTEVREMMAVYEAAMDWSGQEPSTSVLCRAIDNARQGKEHG